jgi:hypothetical protein
MNGVESIWLGVGVVLNTRRLDRDDPNALGGG